MLASRPSSVVTLTLGRLLLATVVRAPAVSAGVQPGDTITAANAGN